MYPNLNKLLHEIDEYHHQRAKKVEILVKFIEHDVIKESIEKALSEFEKKMDPLKEHCHEMRKEVNKLYEEAIKNFQKYSKLFEGYVLASQDLSKPMPKDDFYFVELVFTKSMQDAQLKAQEFGKLITQYWFESKENQSKLLEGLKDSLTKYLTKTHEIHGKTGGGEGPTHLLSALELLKDFIPETEMLNHFDIGKICH
jgi:predicted nuclease with TOPRIM domain